MSDIRERNVGSISGIPFLVFLIAALLGSVFLFLKGVASDSAVYVLGAIPIFLGQYFLFYRPL